MNKTVDVAIIGLGTAGLTALSEVRKVTSNYVLIDPGPFGTTCARVACMPSKVFIQAANDFHRRHALEVQGISGGESLEVDTRVVLEHVRKMRDSFVEGVMNKVERSREHLIQERAEITDVGKDGVSIKAGSHQIFAKRVVIATGSHPVMPPAWEKIGKRIITSDDFFELEDLPKRVAVIGLGVVGAELGQAMSRLGIDVFGFNRDKGVGLVTDPVIQAKAYAILNGEFPITLSPSSELELTSSGVNVVVDGKSTEVDLILASVGRRANLDGLGFDRLGLPLDPRGVPPFDLRSMQVGDLPIFLAGDVDEVGPVVHEAIDDGKIAGFNAVHETPYRYQRRTRIGVTFTSPQMAMVGLNHQALEGRDFVVGEVDFHDQGRSRIQQNNQGLLRVYAERKGGKLLGAEMIAPAGEHLAHLLAWVIQNGLTVPEALQLPFYHPVIETAVRTAFRDLLKKTECDLDAPELAVCEGVEIGLE